VEAAGVFFTASGNAYAYYSTDGYPDRNGCSECVPLLPGEDVITAEADFSFAASFRVSDVRSSGDEDDDYKLLRRPLR
jgi:hypothetical protein